MDSPSAVRVSVIGATLDSGDDSLELCSAGSALGDDSTATGVSAGVDVGAGGAPADPTGGLVSGFGGRGAGFLAVSMIPLANSST